MKQISQVMQWTKESWVESEPDNTDLAIYLHFWRGDELVAMVQCPLDRDTGLAAGQVGAAGFGATTMSMTFESYHSTLGESPNTGKPWEPHEMQYTFEAVPENREKRWVSECLSTSAHERGGDFCFTSQPYWIEGTKVVWGEEQVFLTAIQDGTSAKGVMFEYLQNTMSLPTIEEVMAEKAGSDPTAKVMMGLVTDPEIRLFHTDMATYTALQERKLVTAIMFTAKPGTSRALLIKERMVYDKALGLNEE